MGSSVQVGDTVRIDKVIVNDGDSELFVQFLADNINRNLEVVRVVNEQRGVTVKDRKEKLEDFDLEELLIK